jgi:hypothetical protein
MKSGYASDEKRCILRYKTGKFPALKFPRQHLLALPETYIEEKRKLWVTKKVESSKGGFYRVQTEEKSEIYLYNI